MIVDSYFDQQDRSLPGMPLLREVTGHDEAAI
jgi:hypothetical protein